eukprot:scaffold139825_cov33-Tisochrysis_lutea.AAC.3
MVLGSRGSICVDECHVASPPRTSCPDVPIAAAYNAAPFATDSSAVAPKRRRAPGKASASVA